MGQLGRYRVSRPMLLWPRLVLTRLPSYLSSHSVGVLPGDDYQLVIRDSVAGLPSFTHATLDNSDVLITSGNGVPVASLTKCVSRIVSRMT
jgi:hypothetical protein